jgi:hypothetical protein
VEQKRRLPLIASSAEPSDPPRPGWQWVGFGALAIVVAWLPLSALALAVSGPRLGALAIASAVTLAIAAFVGGFLVGKWGAPHAGVREAALAGLAAGAGAIVASAMSFGFSLALGPALAAVVAVSVPAAALGGRAGVKRR